MFVFALALLSMDYLPLPDPPALVARIGSPAFRSGADTRLESISADGKRLYTASFWCCSHGCSLTQIFVWDAQSGQLLNHYDPGDAAGGAIRSYRFAADGLRLLVHCREKDQELFGKYALRVLNPDTGKLIREGNQWEPPQPALGKFGEFGTSSAIRSDADKWLVCHGAKELVLLNIETGKSVPFAPTVPAEKGWIIVSPDGRTALANATDGTIRLFDIPEGKLQAEWSETEHRRMVGFTANGKSVIGWSRQKTGWALELWSVSGLDRQLILEGQTKPGQVEFAPNGKVFALRHNVEGRFVQPDWEIRDATNGKLLWSLPNDPETARLLFSPDNKTVWSKSSFGLLVPWDLTTGRPAAGAPNPPGAVERFRFLGEDKLLGLSGGFVITWNPATGNELSRVRLPRSIDWEFGCGFDATGERFVYADTDGGIVSWHFSKSLESRKLLTRDGKPLKGQAS